MNCSADKTTGTGTGYTTYTYQAFKCFMVSEKSWKWNNYDIKIWLG